MAHQIAKYVVADEAVNKDVRDPVENEPFPVSIERVPRGTEPKEELDRLLGATGVVEWIRGFHEGYLERQAEMAPGAGPVDLTSYTDPVYRLSEKDFEDLLRRSRIEDPLEVGE